MLNNSVFFTNNNCNGGLPQNFNNINANVNLINNNENVLPNKTPGSSTEYDKSNNKIMKFPVKKFAGIEVKTLTQNSQKRVLKEKIDDTPIDYILGNMGLDKGETYLTLNKRLRQLVNEIPQEVINYENDKQTFYRDELSKNELLKFMPVSFKEFIRLIDSYIVRIDNQPVYKDFSNCLNKYAQQVKNISQSFDNTLSNIKTNSGGIGDKLGDSALIYQLLEKQKSDSDEFEKFLFNEHASKDASYYTKQLIAIKTNYNSYCTAILNLNQNINGQGFNNSPSVIGGLVNDLLRLSQQWWYFNNQGKPSLFNNVSNVVLGLKNDLLTQKFQKFNQLILSNDWYNLKEENWRIVCDFWDEFYKSTVQNVNNESAYARCCLERFINIYKNTFLLQYNAVKLSQLVNNVQIANNIQNANTLNSYFNALEKLHDREVLLKQKRNAAFDISQTIRFYFKNYNESLYQENNNEINEIYDGMLFDGCNGWIPGFYENGEYTEGFLLLWDPINNSTIKITEDELKNCEFPTVGTENPSGKCFANAINAMFVHTPAFYLYFKKLGEKLVALKQNDIEYGQLDKIKKKFPFAYEIGMYVYSLANPGSNQWVKMGQFYDTLGELDKQFSTYAASTNIYLDFLVMRLNQELKVDCNIGSKVDIDLQNGPEANYLHGFYNSEVNILKLDSSPVQKLLNMKNIFVKHHHDCFQHFIALPKDTQTLSTIRLDFGNEQDSANEIPLKNMLARKNMCELDQDDDCKICNCQVDRKGISARCIFDQNSTIVPLIINRGQGVTVFSSGGNSQKDIRTKVPFYVKSGNSYFELVSVEVLSGAIGTSGHLYSFVKDPKTDYWYKFNDAFGGEKVNSEALKDPIEKTGYIYLYQKCSKKKYNDHKNKELCEDISEVSFDPDNLGITKSPLYANDTNGDLQKNDMNNINLAINSLKKHWQDPIIGILDQNGKLLDKKDTLIINSYNQVYTSNLAENRKLLFYSAQTKNFNIWFFLSSIILFLIAILVAILSASLFNPLSIALFVVGLVLLFPSFKYHCFNYYFKKCFACCLSINNDFSKYERTLNTNKNNKYPNMSYFTKDNIIK